MAERKRFRFAGINVELARKLLDEHRAPFPKFYALLPEDERWLRNRDGINPDGQCNHYGNGNCVIFLRDDSYKTATDVRSIVLHELRHWWQYNLRNTPTEKRLSWFYSLRLRIECAIILAAFLVTILCVLANGWATAVGAGCLFFAFGALILLIYDSALGQILYCWFWRLPPRTAWSEHDAERFTKDNQGCPKWKEAIVIQEIGQK